MAAVVDAVVSAGVSEKTKKDRSVSVTAVRLSLLGQDPEGYAKACSALAKSNNTSLDFSRISTDTVIITGSEDKVSPPQLCEKYKGELQKCKGVEVLQDVGHWHVFEDPKGVAAALSHIL
jgi:pimeloyl-ACP methyl ester carboxylesterase